MAVIYRYRGGDIILFAFTRRIVIIRLSNSNNSIYSDFADNQRSTPATRNRIYHNNFGSVFWNR